MELRKERVLRGVASGKPETGLKWAERLRRRARYLADNGELEPSSQGNTTVHRSQFDELKAELRAQLVKERVGGVRSPCCRARNSFLSLSICYRSLLASSSSSPPAETSRSCSAPLLGGSPSWVLRTALFAKECTWMDTNGRMLWREGESTCEHSERTSFRELSGSLPLPPSLDLHVICSVSLSTTTTMEHQPNRLSLPAPSGTISSSTTSAPRTPTTKLPPSGFYLETLPSATNHAVALSTSRDSSQKPLKPLALLFRQGSSRVLPSAQMDHLSFLYSRTELVSNTTTHVKSFFPVKGTILGGIQLSWLRRYVSYHHPRRSALGARSLLLVRV